MLPELVISDFAGTAFRDDGAILDAYRHALGKYDVPFEDAELATHRGANKHAVLLEFVARVAPTSDAAEVLARRALADFEAHLTECYTNGPVSEIEGAETAFRELKLAGVKVALTSGLNRSVTDLLLARLGWSDLFDTSACGDEVRLGRPAPYLIYHCMIDTGVQNVRRVAVVGDTPLDLQAAANANAGWIVGVLSGAYDLDALGRVPHTHLLRSIAQLPPIFGQPGVGATALAPNTAAAAPAPS